MADGLARARVTACGEQSRTIAKGPLVNDVAALGDGGGETSRVAQRGRTAVFGAQAGDGDVAHGDDHRVRRQTGQAISVGHGQGKGQHSRRARRGKGGRNGAGVAQGHVGAAGLRPAVGQCVTVGVGTLAGVQRDRRVDRHALVAPGVRHRRVVGDGDGVSSTDDAAPVGRRDCDCRAGDAPGKDRRVAQTVAVVDDGGLPRRLPGVGDGQRGRRRFHFGGKGNGSAHDTRWRAGDSRLTQCDARRPLRIVDKRLAHRLPGGIQPAGDQYPNRALAAHNHDLRGEHHCRSLREGPRQHRSHFPPGRCKIKLPHFWERKAVIIFPANNPH